MVFNIIFKFNVKYSKIIQFDFSFLSKIILDLTIFSINNLFAILRDSKTNKQLLYLS
jgi:hypothetical protein